MNYLKVSAGIFLVLAATRFIPHPPNFTSLLALSFYVPVFFGVSYIPIVIASFAITDIFFGFHSTLFFTWGSVLLIGLISKYFNGSILKRFSGIFFSVIIFFIFSNFGVWISGMYGFTINGFVTCYFLALPFMFNSLVSTIVFATIIEAIFATYNKMNFKQVIK
tara:strand:+ start:83 stop:574 length:492 start_codon:yes stop_codon:yes gene_type:complete